MNVGATKATLDDIYETAVDRFFESVAHPGEMVGIVAAQSIGEPTTQWPGHNFRLGPHIEMWHVKPPAVKPTLDLTNVHIWDNTISTRDNAQAIKIALGSAVYLDTTKGKGIRQEQMILLAALRHATTNYPMALAIVNNISMDFRKCGYAACKALLTELQGSAMEERKRLEEEITANKPPNEPVQVYVRPYQNLRNLLNKAHV
eukprot:jgi/Tetstr1/465266/TSEL_009968.t1